MGQLNRPQLGIKPTEAIIPFDDVQQQVITMQIGPSQIRFAYPLNQIEDLRNFWNWSEHMANGNAIVNAVLPGDMTWKVANLDRAYIPDAKLLVHGNGMIPGSQPHSGIAPDGFAQVNLHNFLVDPIPTQYLDKQILVHNFILGLVNAFGDHVRVVAQEYVNPILANAYGRDEWEEAIFAHSVSAANFLTLAQPLENHGLTVAELMNLAKES